MADQEERIAERQATADGGHSPESLKKRMRSGKLEESRVRVAAYCGHKSSVLPTSKETAA